MTAITMLIASGALSLLEITAKRGEEIVQRHTYPNARRSARRNLVYLVDVCSGAQSVNAEYASVVHLLPKFASHWRMESENEDT